MKTKHVYLVAFLLTAYFTIGAYSIPPKNSLNKSRKSGYAKNNDLKRRTAPMSLEELTRNLEFGFSKANVQEEYTDQLNELAKTISEGKYALALRGHADSIGTYVGNWKLSDKRAIAVKEYLIKKGVPEDKIVTTPFGSTIPIASNKTSAGRKKNRRVEIKLQEIP